MNLDIRTEASADTGDISRLVSAAFDNGTEEPELIELIRDRGEAIISLVAATDTGLAGHVMVSPITLQPGSTLKTGGVAPVSVVPELQRQGIGSLLMLACIEHAKALDIDALFLLGNPDYYARFGFSQSHIANEYGATDAFMHLELSARCLEQISGSAHYVSAFNEVGA